VTTPHLGKPNRSKRKILKRHRPRRTPIPAPPIKNCNKKRRFKTREDAQIMCDELNKRYAMQEILAEVYYCHKHSAWHVGHDRLGAMLAALKRSRNASKNEIGN
jgi:hypothetical protein